MENLDPTLLWILSALAMVMAIVIKAIIRRTGKEPPTVVLQWIVVVLSFIVAAIWQAPVLPPWTPVSTPIDAVNAALAWMTQLLANLSPVFMLATLIYTTLYKLLAEKLGRAIYNKFKK